MDYQQQLEYLRNKWKETKDPVLKAVIERSAKAIKIAQEIRDKRRKTLFDH